jgi:hypothetical protein
MSRISRHRQKNYPNIETVRYWLNDQQQILHREDGPAVEDTDGNYRAYYVYGKLHRMDGPAREHISKSGISWIEWSINGITIDCNSQEEFEQYMRLKAFW